MLRVLAASRERRKQIRLGQGAMKAAQEACRAAARKAKREAGASEAGGNADTGGGSGRPRARARAGRSPPRRSRTSSSARRATPASPRKPNACRSLPTISTAWSPSPQAQAIDFVVVGPEGPLVLGLVDRLEAAGIQAFGPECRRAALEGSKGFMKDLAAATASRPRPMAASPTPARPRPLCARGALPSWSRPTGSPPARASVARDAPRGRGRDRRA